MPSPFPGMDPYLESPSQWPDFHHEFISALRSEVVDKLPPNYIARIDELVLRVEPETQSRRSMEPDVLISRTPHGGGQTAGGTVVATAVSKAGRRPKVENILPIDPHTESYIELRYRPTNELVTVIELLSPTNKSGYGRLQYLAKRDILLAQPVHLVKIDLIRAGARIEFRTELPKGDYYALVSRADDRPGCDVYNWTVREPMPSVDIPLREPDADIAVDLQVAFASAYQRGRYDRVVRYDQPAPAPKFDAPDADWVLERVRSAAPQ